ncbi:glycoside hydrolase N-terminal domain-containing protein [Catenulispora sp. NL8]|uniref:Glycoside hydrolase N-terminal domain-containing protein n=1 Tax=Catenulispora pinistramenti TaxID=2705254 RepID=A0ABS5KRA1_9ACTN|nr:glycoside hydrolase N-terminal domain-containing protein [Catenulispora pinistramenti]MBS2548583.1 glycoside hydrolase N-terminal domain-containing protein [Catenulispora pinistramenti]
MPEFHNPSRRSLLRGAAAVGTVLAAPGLSTGAARASARGASAATRPIPTGQATTIWYTAPGSASSMMATALPVGNGRLGALFTGDPGSELYNVTDATCWAGGPNADPGSNGFPYDTSGFGTQQMLAQATLNIPAHSMSAVGGYVRQLDLSNGYASTTYTFDGVTYRRDVWASHPDDVVVIHLSQSGGGSYTGSLTLTGTRSESTSSNSSAGTVSFTGALANGLLYAAQVQASASSGSVGASGSGSAVTFTGCSDVLLVISGGTNYSPTTSGFMDPGIVPATVAADQASRATGLGTAALFSHHLADYQALSQAMTINLGTSTAAQRALPTDQRLAAAHSSGADPELHAAFVQFGRYLMISGSRTGLPINLQGPWQDTNSPAWMSDYHTDINIQMNYWLPDRTGLPSCFAPFADYCISQQPSWAQHTQAHFNDASNGAYRNSSGQIAGWTVAISTNPFGGLGWDWSPPGGAWLCNELFDHYLYTQDTSYLASIYPLLMSACQFWQARLITTTDADGNTVLVDDNDWSPEHGPSNQIGITFAQELIWQLFANYRQAASVLGRDSGFAATVAGLQSKLYLPQVSTVTGWLEEWMTPDNLDTGDIQHRHLSPLIGLFPGDRITADQSPAALLTGVTNLLTARGMTSFGWGVAWRAACWARLRNAANAYQCFVNGLTPSTSGSTGTAGNLLDIYSGDTFQIDANLGLPSAAIEMLVYSRPGLLQLLPALPSAWSASGAVTGIGVRGGFTVDFVWSGGQVTSGTLHNIGPAPATITVAYGASSQQITLAAGASAALAPSSGPSGTYVLVNRNSGKAIDDPGASGTAGTKLIQYARDGGSNQSWRLQPVGAGIYNLVNVSSGLLMDVYGGGTADGAPICQYTSTGATNQQWRITDAGGGYVTLVSVRSGKAVGVAGSSTADLAGLEQETISSGAANQQWELISI